MWDPRPTSRCYVRGRLDVPSAWREAPGQFRKQERVALALTESVTLIGEGGDPDEVQERVSKHFGDADMVHLFRPSPPSRHGTVWR